MTIEKQGKQVRVVLLLLSLLAVFLLGVGTVTALASSTKEQTGSIRLSLTESDLASSVEVSLAAVGTYGSDGYAFSYSGVTLDDLADASKAQKVAEDLEKIVLQLPAAKKASANGAKGSISAGGAALGYGESGKILTVGFDNTGALTFTDLVPGIYLTFQTAGEEDFDLQPSLVPIPYIKTDGTSSYDAVIMGKGSFSGGGVILSKVDEEGHPVEGADFVLEEKVYPEDGQVPAGVPALQDANGTYYWKAFAGEASASMESGTKVTGTLPTNAAGQIAIKDMPLGTYRFRETKAPEGFIMSSEMPEFTITGAGRIVSQNAKYVPLNGKVMEVSATNFQTKVSFNKVDDVGKALEGATLTIKDADGKTISTRDAEGNELLTYVFESKETATVLKRLPVGTYYLSELMPPEGFHVADDLKFEVTDSPEGTVVTMVDHPIQTTPNSLTVKKALYAYVDVGERKAMELYHGAFYVALFSDEKGEHRVTEVEKLTFEGQHSQSATFSNLETGTTYYVFETDEAGNPHTERVPWKNEVGNSYLAVYPNGQSVTVKPGATNELDFENEFLLTPIDGNIVGETEKETPGTLTGETEETEKETKKPKKETEKEKQTEVSGKNEGTTSTSAKNVKTGDETPIGLIVGIAVAAVVVIIVIIVILMKRKKKR